MIAIACDHVGFEIKGKIISLLEELGYEVKDFGTNSNVSCDYPAYGYQAACAVASGECERGILICGTGVGISLSANKVNGIRCVVCSEPYSAVLSRNHNNSNMLAFGARVIGLDLAKMIVVSWLNAEFEGGRHQRRVDQLTKIENGQFSPSGS